jgi:hypothetical protein
VRSLTRPGLLVAIAIALTALPTAASGALSAPAAPTAVTANSTNYQDSTGENPAAPDITTLTVSNTDAGVVSFRINIANRPTLGQDMWLDLWVDADNRTTTGSPDLAGVDYVFQLIRGEIALFRWDGTGFTRRFGDPSAVTLRFSYRNGYTISISRSELGNTKGFKFFVEVVSGVQFDPTTGDPIPGDYPGDLAPGGAAGLYPYEVKITPPTLLVRRVDAGRPTAGEPFTLRMRTARSDTGATVQNGRVTCVGRAGNTRLRARVQRVVGGWATCTWNLPPNSKGKRFRGSVTVVFEGLRTTESFASRIG